MAKTIHLTLTGKAEQLFNELEKEGLTERDVISKALSVLSDVHRTKRVALLKKTREQSDAVEFVYGINVTDEEAAVQMPNPPVATEADYGAPPAAAPVPPKEWE